MAPKDVPTALKNCMRRSFLCGRRIKGKYAISFPQDFFYENTTYIHEESGENDLIGQQAPFYTL
jgi:hypothetical protein